MADAYAWMDVLQPAAFQVAARCVQAHQELVDAAARLVPAILVAEAEAARRIDDLLKTIARAADYLNLASNAATVAELLALHGDAFVPTEPLPSIDYIPDHGGHIDVRLVLSLFQCARDRAVAACDSAERCFGLLHSIRFLLVNVPGLPGIDGVLESQRVLANTDLEAALASAVVSAALAVVAKWLVH